MNRLKHIEAIAQAKGIAFPEEPEQPSAPLTTTRPQIGEVLLNDTNTFAQGNVKSAIYHAATKVLECTSQEEMFGLIESGNWVVTDAFMQNQCKVFVLIRIKNQPIEMATNKELFLANGFPEDYIIDRDHEGNEYGKSKQVARCGNAVPPPFAAALVQVNLPELCGGKALENMAELTKQIAI